MEEEEEGEGNVLYDKRRKFQIFCFFTSVYKKIIKSNLADNFYIRTHFDHEADHPIGLSFTRGEVFRVVDTMHRGKLGNWLAIRMGNDLHELDKGTIPNQARSGDLWISRWNFFKCFKC